MARYSFESRSTARAPGPPTDRAKRTPRRAAATGGSLSRGARSFKALTFVTLMGFLAGAVGCSPAREITADTFRVLRVVDGDTFKVRYDGDVTSVRLYGIDAPEVGRPGGAEATAALGRMIDDRDVKLIFCANRKRDNFGRLLARVFVDGREIGPAMMAAGHAKPYEKRSPQGKGFK